MSVKVQSREMQLTLKLACGPATAGGAVTVTDLVAVLRSPCESMTSRLTV